MLMARIYALSLPLLVAACGHAPRSTGLVSDKNACAKPTTPNGLSSDAMPNEEYLALTGNSTAHADVAQQLPSGEKRLWGLRLRVKSSSSAGADLKAYLVRPKTPGWLAAGDLVAQASGTAAPTTDLPQWVDLSFDQFVMLNASDENWLYLSGDTLAWSTVAGSGLALYDDTARSWKALARLGVFQMLECQ